MTLFSSLGIPITSKIIEYFPERDLKKFRMVDRHFARTVRAIEEKKSIFVFIESLKSHLAPVLTREAMQDWKKKVSKGALFRTLSIPQKTRDAIKNGRENVEGALSRAVASLRPLPTKVLQALSANFPEGSFPQRFRQIFTVLDNYKALDSGRLTALQCGKAFLAMGKIERAFEVLSYEKRHDAQDAAYAELACAHAKAAFERADSDDTAPFEDADLALEMTNNIRNLRVRHDARDQITIMRARYHVVEDQVDQAKALLMTVSNGAIRDQGYVDCLDFLRCRHRHPFDGDTCVQFVRAIIDPNTKYWQLSFTRAQIELRVCNSRYDIREAIRLCYLLPEDKDGIPSIASLYQAIDTRRKSKILDFFNAIIEIKNAPTLDYKRFRHFWDTRSQGKDFVLLLEIGQAVHREKFQEATRLASSFTNPQIKKQLLARIAELDTSVDRSSCCVIF